MFIRLRDIKTDFNAAESALYDECAKKLGINSDDIINVKIYKRSLDARRSRPITYTYTADVYIKSNVKYKLPAQAQIIEHEKEYTVVPSVTKSRLRPIVVGAGPAGLFCALLLARAGQSPIVLERGKCVEERVEDVNNFFSTGVLNTASNIQFGEGGAGTFSDGKLNTLIKDKELRGRFVLSELVKAGAPDEILYVNKPHVGTDKLRTSIKNIRMEIERLGGSVLFNHQVIGFEIRDKKIHAVKIKRTDGTESTIETDTVFLGIGHSARDTFTAIKELGIPMERKPFAVGVRIEHKQQYINKTQYSGMINAKLPAADYKLVCHTGTGRSVYTFCMCPGGYVVAAASEENAVTTNGMSNYARDGENANSALLVEIRTDDFTGNDVLAGVKFQRSLERKAFEMGGGKYKAPAQLVTDFLGISSDNEKSVVRPTYSRGVKMSNLQELFPDFITDSLKEGLRYFDKIMSGFAGNGAIMTAVESRSSSPVRILRDKDSLQSEIHGLYPIGEGAGYAGGIMSAAIDGMKAAEIYLKKFSE